MKCKHHGPAAQGVWACPTCLVELREENQRLRSGAVASLFSIAYCSQCGGEFGPGNDGFSHCSDHQAAARPVSGKRIEAALSMRFTVADAIAEAVAAERERSKVLAVWARNALSALETLDAEDMEDGGAQLRLLRASGEKLVKAVLHG